MQSGRRDMDEKWILLQRRRYSAPILHLYITQLVIIGSRASL